MLQQAQRVQHMHSLSFTKLNAYVEKRHTSLWGEPQPLDANLEERGDHRLELLRRAGLVTPSDEKLSKCLNLHTQKRKKQTHAHIRKKMGHMNCRKLATEQEC